MLINDGGGSKKKKKKVVDKGDHMGRTRDEYPVEQKKKPGAGRSRGGPGASGRQASRTDTSRAARDARRVDNKPASGKGPRKTERKPAKSKSIPSKVKPKKTKNPREPKKDNVVKTTPTPKPQTYNAISLVSNQDQSQEILNAYLALAGTELFQYTNSQTIDGMYNDVAIINVLSRRRQQYTPNRLIELAQVFVKYMWVEDGNLCIDIDDPNGVWDQCVLSFTIGSNIEVAYTVA